MQLQRSALTDPAAPGNTAFDFVPCCTVRKSPDLRPASSKRHDTTRGATESSQHGRHHWHVRWWWWWCVWRHLSTVSGHLLEAGPCKHTSIGLAWQRRPALRLRGCRAGAALESAGDCGVCEEWSSMCGCMSFPVGTCSVNSVARVHRCPATRGGVRTACRRDRSAG